MTEHDVQSLMRQRDLWSNNMLLSASATAVLTGLLPVINQTGSLILLALIVVLFIAAAVTLVISVSRWLALRKQIKEKIAHRQWLGKAG